MKITRADPWRLRKPAYLRGLMVDTFRGQVRVRAMPRKRGPSKNAKVLAQNEWFKQANLLAKQAPPSQQLLAIEITKNSGLYPRDLLMRSISGGVFDLVNEDGRKYTIRRRSVTLAGFQGARLELASNVNLLADAVSFIDWETPRIDTAGMWDIGDPAYLTIPEGINIVEFTAPMRIEPGASSGFWSIHSDLQAFCAVTWFPANIQGFGFAGTGPIPVTEGERFRVRFELFGATRVLNASPATAFACTISSIIGS